MKTSPNKVALITGCSSGIGRALSLALHSRGCRVVATAREIEAIVDLKEKGMAVHSLDVTDPGQAKKVVDAVVTEEGSIDILVNNAGYALIGPAIELPSEELVRQLNTNVVAPMVLASLAARPMKEKGEGSRYDCKYRVYFRYYYYTLFRGLLCFKGCTPCPV